jgi:hypothetical protein
MLIESLVGKVLVNVDISFQYLLCKENFDFFICFSDIDECIGNVCQNGATCVDGIDQYTCTCVAGYDGNFCQNSKLTLESY